MSKSPQTLRIALAQLDPVVGDIEGNIAKARAARVKAGALGADLVVLPELFVIGYPPEDLVLKPAFIAAAQSAVEAFARETGDGGPAVVMGTPWPNSGVPSTAGADLTGLDKRPYNAVALLDGGAVAAVRMKADLPNYGPFDEKRVFAPGAMPGPVPFRGVRLGLPICEDIWGHDVVECLSETGAEIFSISPNGSPFEWKKPDVRVTVAVARVTEAGLPLIFVNQVGGQDELVFDGASFVLNSDASLAVQLPAWEEAIQITEWERAADGWRCRTGPKALLEEGDAAAYHASMLGLRDYVSKNGFPGVVLGLSGGVDSALCAAIAADALGPERVHAVMLPYRFTSDESLADAAACAKALGIRYDTVPIAPAVDGLTSMLAPMFAGRPPDIAEENMQSRVRGTTLMAISNKLGAMLVTTGNKSEMSVGYATIYGDMNGGFNPIKDLYKMEVFRLCRWRNAHVPKGGKAPAGRVIPENIIVKPPSAELRENQKDQDSLPPYEILDDILNCLVEQEMPLAAIVARGHSADTVKRIERLLYLAEYKRRQAAPGVKISSRSFGRDRRYPITNRFRETTVASAATPSAPAIVRPRADGGEVS